jgi:endonuclease/exonuclease/phosphatase family metal-dependent hydrolase
VRLQNPATGRPLNVFFTHLQANETGVPFAETSAARAAQIGEAKLFINQWAPPVSDQDTIVAGDLNVHGAPDGEDDNPDFAEYRDLIVGNGGFGGLGLVDTHRLAASPADTMFSFDGDLDSAQRSASRSRLDYVLFRPATSGIVPCVQQTSLRRGYHVETAPGDDYVGTDLSDHFGLDVTVGRTGPNCSPRTALEVAAGDAQLSRSFGGDGDAVQWFHAATPGTYSFSLGGLTNPIVDNTVDIQVFRDSDLSEPLAADLGSTHLVTQHGVVAPNRVVFALDAPFFVRVRAHDPAFAGGYTLIWHRHQGTSFDDAIALDPATRIGQQQFLDHGGDGPEAVFYSFVQHDLDSGARQALRFATEGHPLAQLRIQVFDGGRHLISGLSTGYAAGQQTLTVNPATSPIAGARQRLFFTVDRVGCTGVCASAYQVTWTTNLRRLDLSEFQIETDADGATDDDDEVVMRVRVDGGAEQAIGLGQVHKGSVKRLPAGLREIGFASQVLIRFTETDGLLAGADDVSETRTVAAGALPAGLGDRDDLPTLDLPVHRGGLGGAVVGLYHVRLRGGTRIHD